MNIGIIGLGRMGMAACKRLKDCGQLVAGWDVNSSLADDLSELGGDFAARASDVSKRGDVVITFVTGDESARWFNRSAPVL